MRHRPGEACAHMCVYRSALGLGHPYPPPVPGARPAREASPVRSESALSLGSFPQKAGPGRSRPAAPGAAEGVLLFPGAGAVGGRCGWSVPDSSVQVLQAARTGCPCLRARLTCCGWLQAKQKWPWLHGKWPGHAAIQAIAELATGPPGEWPQASVGGAGRLPGGCGACSTFYVSAKGLPTS